MWTNKGFTIPVRWDQQLKGMFKEFNQQESRMRQNGTLSLNEGQNQFTIPLYENLGSGHGLAYTSTLFFERTLLRHLISKRPSEIEFFPGIKFSDMISKDFFFFFFIYFRPTREWWCINKKTSVSKIKEF